MSITVGIIGAGIAGLGAAIGLRRAGAEVEIFERSCFKNEVGAAITLSPNATRVLEHWGLDFEKARAVQSQQIRLVNPKTLEVLFQDTYAHAHETYGHGTEHFHRVDLHSALRELAEQPDGVGIPAQINLGQKVVDVDCDEGIIVLENGRKITKDFVVVADGIKSHLNSKVTGQEEPLLKTDWSMYRGLVPASKVRSSTKFPILSQIFAPDVAPGFWVPVDLPTMLFFVTYPCRNNEVINVALRHTTLPHEVDKEDWNEDARLEDALKVVEGQHPVMQELLRMVEPGDLKVYKLMWRNPIQKVVRGRTVAMGDSAQTVQPQHFQGGALAIEEAGAIEVFFQDLITSSPASALHSRIPDRLLLYQSFLLPRILLNQHLTNSEMGTQDEHRLKAEQICEEQQKLAQQYLQQNPKSEYSGTATGGKPLFSATAAFVSPETQEFFWSWNVRGESKAFLARENTVAA